MILRRFFVQAVPAISDLILKIPGIKQMSLFCVFLTYKVKTNFLK